MTQSLENLTQALLEHAIKAGADAADAIAVRGTSTTIDVRGGALEQAERSEGVDIGLRVMIGQRQANVSSSDVKPETMAIMAHMKRGHHLDPELMDLFVTSGVYRRYAERYLPPDLVDEVALQHSRHEAGSGSHHPVRREHALGDERRPLWFDADRLEARLARLQRPGHAHERASGAEARDEGGKLLAKAIGTFKLLFLAGRT